MSKWRYVFYFVSIQVNPIAYGYSPSALLMGCKLRTILPILPEQLQSKLPNCLTICKRQQQIKEKQKQNYNKCHKVIKLPPLQKGNKSVATINGEEQDSYETARNTVLLD